MARCREFCAFWYLSVLFDEILGDVFLCEAYTGSRSIKNLSSYLRGFLQNRATIVNKRSMFLLPYESPIKVILYLYSSRKYGPKEHRFPYAYHVDSAFVCDLHYFRDLPPRS